MTTTKRTAAERWYELRLERADLWKQRRTCVLAFLTWLGISILIFAVLFGAACAGSWADTKLREHNQAVALVSLQAKFSSQLADHLAACDRRLEKLERAMRAPDPKSVPDYAVPRPLGSNWWFNPGPGVTIITNEGSWDIKDLKTATNILSITNYSPSQIWYLLQDHTVIPITNGLY